MAYLAVLLLFTGTLYGQLDVSTLKMNDKDIFTVYTRGEGVLTISAIKIYLLLLTLYIGVVCRKCKKNVELSGYKVGLLLAMLSVYYLLYALIGYVFGVTFQNIVASSGGVCFVFMLMFHFVLKRSLIRQSNIDRFCEVFIVITVAMAVYGLARLPFGGDPANYYANFEKKAVVLTFFDIGQGAISCVALVLLVLKRKELFPLGLWRGIWILLLIANIILSYRREAWVGILLVLGFAIYWGPMIRKVFLLVLGALLIVTILFVSESRFTSVAHSGKDQTFSDITNKSGNVVVKSGRFGELYAAVMVTLFNSPVFGLGPWGNQEITARDGVLGFVHSSFVHIFSKMGFVGLTLYFWFIVGFFSWWLRTRKKRWNNNSLLRIGDAFFLGFIFFVPDLLFGTPTIIYRHYQLLTLFMTIPFTVWQIDQAETQ
ncbi:MAG: hypothetical protein FD177_2219 [Desulfovibrionaceae bacterium]|nr:MAG: hypothetical protein FD177_2219 [Desulfovibrionaceae bacterium]